MVITVKDYDEIRKRYGTPLKELQQVLPGHNRSQIQVLLRELRKEDRAFCVGNTSAARWFAGSAATKKEQL